MLKCLPQSSYIIEHRALKNGKHLHNHNQVPLPSYEMEGHNCSKDEHKSFPEHPQPQVVVVMLPFPAQGHLNQLLHLSHHLITAYGLPVHYAGSSSHNYQAKLRFHGRNLSTLNNIIFHDFKLPSYTSPPPNVDNSIHFPSHLQPLAEASVHLRQPISQLLQQLSNNFKRIIVIFDTVMTSVVQDVKNIPNAESYAFVPISAFTAFFNSWDRKAQKPFELDSDVPKEIPTTDGCLTPEFSNFVVNQVKCLGFESGRLYNTSRLIDGKYLELQQKLSRNEDMKQFAVGPLNPVEIINKNEENRHVCLQWLDKQEKGSVIYVSFGSTTSMTNEQITELALGLERSEQKFVWVLRRADTGDLFTGSGEVIRNPELPEGYEERVKNKGLVVREWVPQIEILTHPSVGGFMSHCGWNSCMESISMGVPMAAWPMHSDQPRNAVLVTEVLRIGTLVRDWAHRTELVKSTIIVNVLRTLMQSEEGKEMGRRAAELGDAIRKSVVNGGASRPELDSFVSHITRS